MDGGGPGPPPIQQNGTSEPGEREKQLEQLLEQRIQQAQMEQVDRIRELLQLEKQKREQRQVGDKIKRERLSTKQMAERLAEDEELCITSKYARCTRGCGVVYSITNKHSGCKIRNLQPSGATAVPAQQELTEFKDVFMSETRCHKQSLVSALDPVSCGFVVKELQKCTVQVHRSRFFASPMMHGFLTNKMRAHQVDMSRIEQVMPDPQTGVYDAEADELGKFITLNAASFKVALVSCTSENNQPNKDSGRAPRGKSVVEQAIRKYCLQNFLGDDVPNTVAALGSLKRISSSGALSAAAVQWMTNHEQMMATIVWKRTKYWVAHQLTRIIGEIELFRTQRPVLMRPIRAWLARYITCDKYVEWMSTESEERLRSHFQKYMQSRIKNQDHLDDQEPWSRLWNDLWSACLRVIVRVLAPLELASKGTTIATSKQKGRAFRKKAMDSNVCAAYRCTWVYAVEKQLSEQAEQQADGAHHLKLSHLTPQVGFIPGHMFVDGNLMRHIWNDYQAQAHNTSKTKPSSDSNEWHAFFRFPETFWLDLDRKRSCSTFSTDGISISFHKERMVTKRIRNLEWVLQQQKQQQQQPQQTKKVRVPNDPAKKRKAPPATEPKENGGPAARLHYLEQESIETLQARNTTGILAIDTNRKNMFVGVYRPLDQLVAQEQDDGTDELPRPAIPFHVVIRLSKREYKYLRKIKRDARVRDAIYEKTMPDMPQEWMTPPSLKGSSPQQLALWREWANTDDRANQLLNIFALHTFRRLRLESYSAERRMWPAIQSKIYKQIAAGVRREQDRLIREGRNDEAARLQIPVNPRTIKLPPLPRKVNGVRPLENFPQLMPPSPRLLIAFGDGSFRHNSAGHVTMPSGNKMYRALEQLGEHMCWMDEFRTSKCCSSCGEDTEDAILLKKPPRERKEVPRKSRRPRNASVRQLAHADRHDQKREQAKSRANSQAEAEAQLNPSLTKQFTRPQRRVHCAVTTSELSRIPKLKELQFTVPVGDDPALYLHQKVVAPWGLRACVSAQCRKRLWCRDVNACCNMLRRAVYWLVHKCAGPAYLLRSADEADDPVVGAGVEAAAATEPTNNTTTIKTPKRRRS